MGVFYPPLPVWKEKFGVLVNGPEISQNLKGFFRQRNQPVLVAFGVANVDSHVTCVDVACFQGNALAEAQPQ